ncbi:hypothetical protein DV736_g3742, partial [Chaetothyriales sp. CBS 134916]
MRLELSDNLLLFATCIGLYVSYRTVFHQLYAIKKEARTPKPPPSSPRPRELDPNAEDQIDAETLHTLSKSPNYELRNAAIKIFIDRAARSESRKLLLKDLRSVNSEKRHKAIKGLSLLLYVVDLNHSDRHQKRMHELEQSKETYQSLVTALINVQSEQNRPQREQAQSGARWMTKVPPSPILPLRRSPEEFELMRMLIYTLVNYKGNPIDPIGTALQAGLVSQWLANYPFPCALPGYSVANFKKSDVVTLCERGIYEMDDTLMSGLIRLLIKDRRAMKELQNAGLTTKTFKDDVRPCMRRRNWNLVDDMMIEVPMNVDEGPIGLERFRTVDTGANGPRIRSVERSHEENRLRRRHREAIVVADRDEPLSRENILQRQDSEMGVSPIGVLGELEGDDRRSQASTSSDESMPQLEDIPAGSINRHLNESPHSFRQRVIERQPWRGEGLGWTQDEHEVMFLGSAEGYETRRRFGNEIQGRRTETVHEDGINDPGNPSEIPD